VDQRRHLYKVYLTYSRIALGVFVRSSEIRINNNGMIQLVDRVSNSSLWEISTGPPPSQEVTIVDSSMKYLIYPVHGNPNELVEFNNGTAAVCLLEHGWFSKIFLIPSPSSTLSSSCRYFPGHWRILLPELHTYRCQNLDLRFVLDLRFFPFIAFCQVFFLPLFRFFDLAFYCIFPFFLI
jgi:hypothetical protein